MTSTNPFRDPAATKTLAEAIQREAEGAGDLRFMEVCGTHTVSIHRYGLRAMLPENLRLVSGPGCPVCVTAITYIDHAIALARRPDVILTTFGDLMRVPGSSTSLEKQRAAGADVRVVTSPVDALDIAGRETARKVVFLGVGFETTAPTVALSVVLARSRGIKNYFVLSGHKVMPPALRALAAEGRVQIDGFLMPGHVSAVIGAGPYQFLVDEFRLPCVVTGFEPVDVLQGVWMLLRQITETRPAVEIQYRRAVKAEGNPRAVSTMQDVFEPSDADWRGIGSIPGSGLALRAEFAAFDAAAKIDADIEPTVEKKGCICGLVLQGFKEPADCPLFGKACTPQLPVGACMVSSEGSCAAAFKYGGDE